MAALNVEIENLRKAVRELDQNLSNPILDTNIFPTLSPILREVRGLIGSIDLNHLASVPIRTLASIQSKIFELTDCIKNFMVPSFPVDEQVPAGGGLVRPESHVRNQVNINSWRGKLESLHEELFSLIGSVVAQQQIRLAQVSTASPVDMDLARSMVEVAPETVVWRYMALRNLLRCENNSGIWMPSLKTLAAWSKRGIVDTHEGEIPPIVQRLKEEYDAAMKAGRGASDAFMKKNGWEVSDFERLGKILSNSPSELESTFVSSWSQKKNESTPMWHLYGDQERGVGVRTTLSKLLNNSWGLPPELAGKIGANCISRPILREVKYFGLTESDKPASIEALLLPFSKRD